MADPTSATTDTWLPATKPAPPPAGGTVFADSATADPDRKGPGRPRSARVDEAIVSSVIDMLVEGIGAESLSIEAVAARAGVGKATIYRRWANKDALLVDAVASLKGPLPEVAGESVRDDLVALLRPVGRSTTTKAATVLPCLIAELKRSPMLNQCYQRIVEPRRQLIRDVLWRGIGKGELRPDFDVEVVLALLVGPVLVQSMLNWNPALDGEKLPEQIVDMVWVAIAAR
jgi:AcrR family transcriptional regulator